MKAYESVSCKKENQNKWHMFKKTAKVELI